MAGTLAKVGDVLDPIGAAAKTVGAAARALPRVADLTAGVRAATDATAVANATHSYLEFPDGSQLRVSDGEFIPGRNGVPDTTPAPHEPAATGRAPSIATPHDRELVGAGSRAAEAIARTGENQAPRAGHETPHDSTAGSGSDGTTGTPQNHGGHNAEHTGDGSRHVDHAATGHGGSVDHQADTPLGGTESVDGSGSGQGFDDSPSPGSEGNGSPPDGEARPMDRGGETEQRVRAAIKGLPGKERPQPKLLEKVLDRLASEPDGQRVAEIIASGRFNQSDEFSQVVKSLGANKQQMFRPSADQIIFADDLVRSGVPARAIDFEQKYPVGADMDVRVADESGKVYAYQMKHLADPQDPIEEITRGKYLLQLARAEADHHVLLVDGGRGTRADWIANGSYDALMDIHRGGKGPKGEGIAFVVRLEDGNLVIPPGSKLDPKDIL